MKVRIIVNFKESVLDPQGRAVCGALRNLGFDAVKDVRVGKVIYITLDGVSEDKIGDLVDEMCAKLLVNPVIETYQWEIVDG